MVEKPRVGIIGDGNVGSALTQGLSRAGYDVEAVGHEPPRVKQVAGAAQVIILAVPFGERQNALREMGEEAYRGKTLVDVTNAVAQDGGFAIDPRKESGAEQLQGWARGASVVKAFNTVFAQHMDKGTLHGEPLSVLVAGDDEGARQRVEQLARDIGFDAVDAGKLQNARWLEAMGMLNMKLGYEAGLGPTMGFRLVREASEVGQRAAGQERRATR